jgi:hypothetical protein
MDRSSFVKNLWLWKCGMPEIEDVPQTSINIDQLAKSEWSTKFEQLMRNRLIMGAIRYGVMGHGSIPKGKPKYDRVASIKKRLQFYEDTGNAEWLVDIANMALLMFEERPHPNFHFDSVDDIYHDKPMKK